MSVLDWLIGLAGTVVLFEAVYMESWWLVALAIALIWFGVQLRRKLMRP
jgi:hypothetical protein